MTVLSELIQHHVEEGEKEMFKMAQEAGRRSWLRWRADRRVARARAEAARTSRKRAPDDAPQAAREAGSGQEQGGAR